MRLSRPIRTCATTSIHSRGGIALADAAIEQIDLFGNLQKQRIERLVQNLKPGHFGVTQIDDDADAIGSLDPRLPQGIAQTKRGGPSPTALLPVFCASDIRWWPLSRGVRRPVTYQ